MMELYDDFDQYEDPMVSLRQFIKFTEVRGQNMKSTTTYKKGTRPTA